LLAGFQELLRFVETSGAAPAELADDLSERLLFARLETIRANPQQRERLLRSMSMACSKRWRNRLKGQSRRQPQLTKSWIDDFLDNFEPGGERIV